jgi:hypothetical protein
VTGDVDPRELAHAAIEKMDLSTASQEFRAVRDWVAELPAVEAQWLEQAVHSGRVYAEWLHQA